MEVMNQTLFMNSRVCLNKIIIAKAFEESK